MDPVSIVFNSSFWLNILVYQLLVYPMIGQLCEFTLKLMSLGFARAESNKHVKQVKLSYTAPFDVLTQATVFSGRPRVSGWIEVFEKGAYGLSPFFSLRFSLVRFFSARSLFLLVR